MKNRFDLEDCITRIYTTADDIRVFADTLYDSDINYSQDDIHTILHGIAGVLEAKTEVAYDTFTQMLSLGQYAPEEVKALRNEWGQFNLDLD